MSLDFYVALNRKDIPSTDQWASALRDHGFTVLLDPSLDPSTSSGFWPCPDSNQGFEYSVAPLTREELSNLGLSSKNEERLRHFDSLAVLSYKTEADLAVTQPASAVLSNICGGVLIEGESGAFIPADQALDWARGGYEPASETKMQPLLAKRRISSVTLIKLALFICIAGYWLYRWAT
ncbi:hypothetical protein [Nitrogeniibacter aestuarii]|uniref:hypothetical protein n=1 Tax=Nitrogeniibacter aestuarii TaxID=2815343 RepID=UPI001E397918|nr:hypothetical protein [Nitrogeniibacter aestuarii]